MSLSGGGSTSFDSLFGFYSGDNIGGPTAVGYMFLVLPNHSGIANFLAVSHFCHHTEGDEAHVCAVQIPSGVFRKCKRFARNGFVAGNPNSVRNIQRIFLLSKTAGVPLYFPLSAPHNGGTLLHPLPP